MENQGISGQELEKISTMEQKREPEVSSQQGTITTIRENEVREKDKKRLEDIRSILENTTESGKSPQNERLTPKGKNRLIRVFEKLVPAGFKIEIEGQDYLKEIKDNENVVIASSHITDNDMVITMAALGKATESNERFGQTKLVQMAGNFQNPFFTNIVKATGKENWLSVNVVGDADHRINQFDPRDFEQINSALERGYPVAIAESLDPKSNGWNLPSKSGNGVARLALEGATVIPIAVEISVPLPMKKEFKSQVASLWHLVKRPKTKVHFGRPIRIGKNTEISAIDSVILKRSRGEKITPEEFAEFKKTKHEINAISALIKEEIAKLLPENRRPQQK